LFQAVSQLSQTGVSIPVFRAPLGPGSVDHGAYCPTLTQEAAQWGQIALSENPRCTAAACPTAASYGAMGNKDAARHIAQIVLGVNPAFRASVHAARYPYRETARRDALEQHLVAAGLPH
jgi:hypothetical protein